ncbi:MAG: glycine cleavage system protein GcvH [Rhodospirillales bacterium]|jgi:glycine cleavage system H protein|nr:glycine cleavage system protein GcvH [Rhodospirillales bacterium]HJO97197.1 glycine cleavage system protein GcvH [Rhodospirillales bacterium]
MTTHRYTKEHEWARLDGDTATVGLSNYAQEQLGDIVYIDLPDQGTALEKGAEAAVVESVKAASEVYTPVSGEVTEANAALTDDPAKVNGDAEGEGWLFKIKVAEPGQLDDLMDDAAYKDYVAGLD